MANQQQFRLPSLEDVERELARRSLLSYTRYTKPDYEVNWHHERMCQLLDEFIAGLHPRLMILAPPRTGKSELVSRRLPSYILGKDPNHSIISTSYSADLAQAMNRDVQRIIDSERYRNLFPDTVLFGANIRTVASGTWLRNSDIFEIVGKRGVYKCAGRGGGITGLGAHTIIVDDPIKNQEEALSPKVRETLWEWFTSTLYTRLEKAGKILVTLTPWNEDDLAGRLLKAMREMPGADQWKVVKFPMICEQVIEDDPRAPGDVLWPNKYSKAAVEAIKSSVGSYVFTSLYQCAPKAKEGGIIKCGWFKLVDAAPAIVKSRLRWWDRAATEKTQVNDPDYTAGAKVSVDADGIVCIEDIRAFREGSLANEREIRLTAELDGIGVPQWMEQEPGSSGKDTISHYSRVVLQGFDFHGEPSTGPKENYIDIFAAAAEAGNVRVVKGPWNALFFEQVAAYPMGTHDDLLEAAAKAYCKQTVRRGQGMLDYFEQQYKRKMAEKQQQGARV